MSTKEIHYMQFGGTVIGALYVGSAIGSLVSPYGAAVGAAIGLVFGAAFCYCGRRSIRKAQ